MDTNEEVMAVDKRLARLEETVAKGFFEQSGLLGKLEGHLGKLEGPLGKLEGRLGKLEGRFDKVDAQLHAHTGRFDRLEDRMVAFESKMDVVAESIRGDIQTAITEMRRTTASIRAEHAADRRLTREALRDQVLRIRALEAPDGPGG